MAIALETTTTTVNSSLWDGIDPEDQDGLQQLPCTKALCDDGASTAIVYVEDDSVTNNLIGVSVDGVTGTSLQGLWTGTGQDVGFFLYNQAYPLSSFSITNDWSSYQWTSRLSLRFESVDRGCNDYEIAKALGIESDSNSAITVYRYKTEYQATTFAGLDGSFNSYDLFSNKAYVQDFGLHNEAELNAVSSYTFNQQLRHDAYNIPFNTYDSTIGQGYPGRPLDVGAYSAWPVPEISGIYTGFNKINVFVRLIKKVTSTRSYVYYKLVSFNIPTDISGDDPPDYQLSSQTFDIRTVHYQWDPEYLGTDYLTRYRFSGENYVVADTENYWSIVDDASWLSSRGYEWLWPGAFESYINGQVVISDEDDIGVDVEAVFYDALGGSYTGDSTRILSQSFAGLYTIDSSLLPTTGITELSQSGTLINTLRGDGTGYPYDSASTTGNLFVLHTKIFDLSLEMSNDRGSTYFERLVIPPGYGKVYYKVNVNKVNSTNDPSPIDITLDYGDGTVTTYEWNTGATSADTSFTATHEYYSENQIYYPKVTATTREQTDPSNPGYPIEYWTDDSILITTQRLFMEYPGMCYRYEFNSDSWSADSLSNSNGLFVSGNAGYSTDGMFGCCFSADGLTDSYIGLEYPLYTFDNLSQSAITGPNTNHDLNMEWTVSAWINMDEGYLGSGMVLTRESKSKSYQFFTSSNAVASKSYAEGLFVTPITYTGAWKNLVWRKVDDQIKFYVDGELEGEDTWNPDYWNVLYDPDNPNYPVIGKEFKGRLDDLRIYNRALSTKEVYDLSRAEVFNLRFDSSVLTASSETIDNSNVKWLEDSSDYSFTSISGDCTWYSGNQFGKGYCEWSGETVDLTYDDNENALSSTGNGEVTIQIYGNFNTTDLPENSKNIVTINNDGFAQHKVLVYGNSSYPSDTNKRMYFSWYTHSATTLLPVANARISDADYITEGEFHLYTMTYRPNLDDPTALNFYKDGVLVSSDYASKTVGTSSVSAGGMPTLGSDTSVLIGGNGISNTPLSGSIGQVKIWKKELTAEDVYSEYKKIASIDEYGALEVLELDEIERDTASFDATGRTAYFEEFDEIGPTSGLVMYHKFDNTPIDYSMSGNNWTDTPDGFSRFYSYGGVGQNYSQSLTIWDDVSGGTEPRNLATTFTLDSSTLVANRGTLFMSFKDLSLCGNTGYIAGSGYTTMMSVGASVVTALTANYIHDRSDNNVYVALSGSLVSAVGSNGYVGKNNIDGWSTLAVSVVPGITLHNVYVYVDGELKTSGKTSSLSTAFDKYSIFNNEHATDTGGDQVYISTVIGEFRVYNRALSAEEIGKLDKVARKKMAITDEYSLFTANNLRET